MRISDVVLLKEEIADGASQALTVSLDGSSLPAITEEEVRARKAERDRRRQERLEARAAQKQLGEVPVTDAESEGCTDT